jgi:hypothetical protein
MRRAGAGLTRGRAGVDARLSTRLITMPNALKEGFEDGQYQR